MTSNGRHDPVTYLLGTPNLRDVSLPVADPYDDLLEMDRLEELLEVMGELGIATRAAAEALPPGPASVEVIAELDALGMADTAQIERRLAELEASLDDE